MSEESSAPTGPDVKIDPFPVLPDVLNHFEMMIHSQGALIERLVQIVREAKVPVGNLEDLYNHALSVHQNYWAFKTAMLEKAKREAGHGE